MAPSCISVTIQAREFKLGMIMDIGKRTIFTKFLVAMVTVTIATSKFMHFLPYFTYKKHPEKSI